MLKVVIADDEIRICRLIQLLADWDALGMEVVGIASNGLEALELIDEFHPDILITDIRMPGCHGLELIERAKANFPNLEFIIISGYAHFEYAQTAIKHGVGDYLLKPIKKTELTVTLKKLGDRCRERNQSEQEVAQLKKSNQDSVEHLWDNLIWDMAEQRLITPTAQLLRERYQFEVQPGLLQMFILKMDYDLKFFSPASIAVIRETTEQLLRSELGNLCQNLAFSFRAPRVWGLVNFASANRENIRRAMRQCVNQLTAQCNLFGPATFSAALGEAVHRPEDLQRSYQSARMAIAERLVEGTGRVLEGAPPPSGLRDRNLLERYHRAMEQAVETADITIAKEAVDQLEQETASSADALGSEILELAEAAGQSFLLRLNMQNRDQALRGFISQCDQCSQPKALFDCLRELQQEQMSLAEGQRKNEAIRPIRIAKQYIQQHYSEPISLEDVCAVTGFSVSYFSAMFKKESGEGFAKYLTRIRMERAKELLQETNEPITEICRMVGYGDLRHFTQTFKRTTNLNPGQYRKLYG